MYYTCRSYQRRSSIASEANRVSLSFSEQAPIRWFEPEAYKAKLAAAGPVAILPIGEAETDLE